MLTQVGTDLGGHGPYKRKRKAKAKDKSHRRKLKMRNNYMVKGVDTILKELKTGEFETRWDSKASLGVLDPHDPRRPYCTTCARNFQSKAAFESHIKEKTHKKRLKRLRKQSDDMAKSKSLMREMRDKTGIGYRSSDSEYERPLMFKSKLAKLNATTFGVENVKVFGETTDFPKLSTPTGIQYYSV